MSTYDCDHRGKLERREKQVGSIHDVFSDPHRQAILHYLEESEEPASLCDVAQTITGWVERDGTASVADRTTAWLLHTHVLAMEEFGLVDYDPETDTIRLPDDVAITVSPPANAE